MIYTLSRNHLAAVSLFTANKDVRYYLNGVLVEVTPRAIRMCATQDHVLALTHSPVPYGERDLEPRTVIIPNDAVAAILKPSKGLDFILLDDNNLGVISGMYSVKFDPIDGKFPDYTRVIPDKVDGTPAQYNMDYLSLFAKAKRIYSPKTTHSPSIAHNGNGAAIVYDVDSGFIGVIMPFRGSPYPGLPEWFTGPQEFAAAAD